jgi:hypothetical protein
MPIGGLAQSQRTNPAEVAHEGRCSGPMLQQRQFVINATRVGVVKYRCPRLYEISSMPIRASPASGSRAVTASAATRATIDPTVRQAIRSNAQCRLGGRDHQPRHRVVERPGVSRPCAAPTARPPRSAHGPGTPPAEHRPPGRPAGHPHPGDATVADRCPGHSPGSGADTPHTCPAAGVRAAPAPRSPAPHRRRRSRPARSRRSRRPAAHATPWRSTGRSPSSGSQPSTSRKPRRETSCHHVSAPSPPTDRSQEPERPTRQYIWAFMSHPTAAGTISGPRRVSTSSNRHVAGSAPLRRAGGSQTRHESLTKGRPVESRRGV